MDPGVESWSFCLRVSGMQLDLGMCGGFHICATRMVEVSEIWIFSY